MDEFILMPIRLEKLVCSLLVIIILNNTKVHINLESSEQPESMHVIQSSTRLSSVSKNAAFTEVYDKVNVNLTAQSVYILSIKPKRWIRFVRSNYAFHCWEKKGSHARLIYTSDAFYMIYETKYLSMLVLR